VQGMLRGGEQKRMEMKMKIKMEKGRRLVVVFSRGMVRRTRVVRLRADGSSEGMGMKGEVSTNTS
jgi:hypothetical protein